MVDVAFESGADAAKFQLYSSEHFIAKSASFSDGSSVREFFRQYELKRREWESLAKYVRKKRMDFLCSVFDLPSLELYLSLNPSIVKIASGDVNNRILIEAAAGSGLPVLLSTGTADQREVDQAVRWIGGRFALMHCVSSYPANPFDFNLRVIPEWIKKYGVPVGLSDHSLDRTISIAAVALGATMIERHFTIDKMLSGPDHAISLEPNEFRELSYSMKNAHRALGDGIKRCTDSELGAREGGRRSLYALKTIHAGDTLSERNIIALRPGSGLPPEAFYRLAGKPAKKEYAEGDML
jgi:sialic acid synthase SpsE